jgi:hypothetical protein
MILLKIMYKQLKNNVEQIYKNKQIKYAISTERLKCLLLTPFNTAKPRFMPGNYPMLQAGKTSFTLPKYSERTGWEATHQPIPCSKRLSLDKFC